MTKKDKIMITLKMLEEQAAKLEGIRKQVKALEAEEKAIKENLKKFVGGAGDARLGSMLIVVSDRVRTSIDSEAAKKLLGRRYEQCLNKTEFQTVEVKRA